MKAQSSSPPALAEKEKERVKGAGGHDLRRARSVSLKPNAKLSKNRALKLSQLLEKVPRQEEPWRISPFGEYVKFEKGTTSQPAMHRASSSTPQDYAEQYPSFSLHRNEEASSALDTEASPDTGQEPGQTQPVPPTNPDEQEAAATAFIKDVLTRSQERFARQSSMEMDNEVDASPNIDNQSTEPTVPPTSGDVPQEILAALESASAFMRDVLAMEMGETVCTGGDTVGREGQQSVLGALDSTVEQSERDKVTMQMVRTGDMGEPQIRDTAEEQDDAFNSTMRVGSQDVEQSRNEQTVAGDTEQLSVEESSLIENDQNATVAIDLSQGRPSPERAQIPPAAENQPSERQNLDLSPPTSRARLPLVSYTASPIPKESKHRFLAFTLENISPESDANETCSRPTQRDFDKTMGGDEGENNLAGQQEKPETVMMEIVTRAPDQNIVGVSPSADISNEQNAGSAAVETELFRPFSQLTDIDISPDFEQNRNGGMSYGISAAAVEHVMQDTDNHTGGGSNNEQQPQQEETPGDVLSGTGDAEQTSIVSKGKDGEDAAVRPVEQDNAREESARGSKNRNLSSIRDALRDVMLNNPGIKPLDPSVRAQWPTRPTTPAETPPDVVSKRPTTTGQSEQNLPPYGPPKQRPYYDWTRPFARPATQAREYCPEPAQVHKPLSSAPQIHPDRMRMLERMVEPAGGVDNQNKGRQWLQHLGETKTGFNHRRRSARTAISTDTYLEGQDLVEEEDEKCTEADDWDNGWVTPHKTSLATYRVEIQNLNPEATTEDINHTVAACGRIISCSLMYNNRGVSTGVAQISFANREDARKVIEMLDGKLADGKVLKVIELQPVLPEQRSAPLPSFTGPTPRRVQSQQSTHPSSPQYLRTRCTRFLDEDRPKLKEPAGPSSRKRRFDDSSPPPSNRREIPKKDISKVPEQPITKPPTPPHTPKKCLLWGIDSDEEETPAPPPRPKPQQSKKRATEDGELSDIEEGQILERPAKSVRWADRQSAVEKVMLDDSKVAAAVNKWQKFAEQSTYTPHPAVKNDVVGDGNLHRMGHNYFPTTEDAAIHDVRRKREHDLRRKRSKTEDHTDFDPLPRPPSLHLNPSFFNPNMIPINLDRAKERRGGRSASWGPDCRDEWRRGADCYRPGARSESRGRGSRGSESRGRGEYRSDSRGRGGHSFESRGRGGHGSDSRERREHRDDRHSRHEDGKHGFKGRRDDETQTRDKSESSTSRREHRDDPRKQRRYESTRKTDDDNRAAAQKFRERQQKRKRDAPLNRSPKPDKHYHVPLPPPISKTARTEPPPSQDSLAIGQCQRTVAQHSQAEQGPAIGGGDNRTVEQQPRRADVQERTASHHEHALSEPVQSEPISKGQRSNKPILQQPSASDIQESSLPTTSNPSSPQNAVPPSKRRRVIYTPTPTPTPHLNPYRTSTPRRSTSYRDSKRISITPEEYKQKLDEELDNYFANAPPMHNENQERLDDDVNKCRRELNGY